jgi:uridine phosphorylase
VLVRVGTCGAIVPSLALGEIVIASQAIAADGTSRALGAGERLAGDPSMLSALRAAGDGAVRAATVASTDLFYDGRAGQEDSWRAAGAAAVEMETATLYALAAARGLQAGSLLIVTDVILPERVRIEAEALRAAELRLGELAVQALRELSGS